MRRRDVVLAGAATLAAIPLAVRNRAEASSHDTVACTCEFPSYPHQATPLLLGGDPIKNNSDATSWEKSNYWGTAAFCADQITVKHLTQTTTVTGGAILSCNHVLAALDNGSTGTDTISCVVAELDPLATLHSYFPITYMGAPPIDVALAKLTDANKASYKEIRALGFLSSVRQPASGDRIHKYGAWSGLTTGEVDGWDEITFAAYGGRTIGVMKTTGNFADVHDSGAAVLDEDRNFVGLLIAGRVTGARQKKDPAYFIPAVPLGGTFDPPPGGISDPVYIELAFS